MSGREPDLAVVYLVWGPLGPEPVREFINSYTRHPPGISHELVVLLNGVEAQQRAALLAPLAGVAHTLLELEEPVQDLAAYARAAVLLEHELVCCLNTYSVILADGWLNTLARATLLPDVGLAGASGSWESQAEWRRGQARHWLRHLSAARTLRRDFPRFPNPHLRTTAFAIERQLLVELDLERASEKYVAYLLESGRQSITRMVQDCGLRVLVAGRDGRVYDPPQWARSATYRSGAQQNLLVADRRTRDFSQASPRARKRLSRDAWGRSRAGEPLSVAAVQPTEPGASKP